MALTRSLQPALVSLVLAACAASTTFAQEKPADLPIAVINLDQVFNGYKKHAERLAPVREELKDFDEAVQVRQVELETAANQLRRATPGTPEHIRLQGQAIKLQNDLRVFVEQERQKLQKREASVLVATHRDVDEQIKKFCKDRGLKLVLRQYNPPADNQPLQEVLKGLSRDVIYQDGLDITEDVIEALNETKPDGT
jgi:Skp family chaperone for outer membrane proteins